MLLTNADMTLLCRMPPPPPSAFFLPETCLFLPPFFSASHPHRGEIWDSPKQAEEKKKWLVLRTNGDENRNTHLRPHIRLLLLLGKTKFGLNILVAKKRAWPQNTCCTYNAARLHASMGVNEPRKYFWPCAWLWHYGMVVVQVESIREQNCMKPLKEGLLDFEKVPFRKQSHHTFFCKRTLSQLSPLILCVFTFFI